jgi:predicted ATPase
MVGKGRGIAGLESPLVGREPELRALLQAVDRLRAGVGGIVTLVGEAGIGKSRLIAELGQAARQPTVGSVPAGVPEIGWIEGRCLSLGSSIAYSLWIDLLRSLLGVTAGSAPIVLRNALQQHTRDLCTDRFDGVYPYLGRLLSLPLEAATEARLRNLDAESLKHATFRAFEHLIEGAALRHPLTVVCEDLHWADPSSLELLERLLALTDRAALLFVCVLRPETEHGSWHLKEAASRLYPHRCTYLWLDPLSAEEGEALVDHLLSSSTQEEDKALALSPALKQRILSHAEGNPFYAEEIIRALIDSQILVQDSITGSWRAVQHVSDIALPDTLHGVLTSRIDRLPGQAKQVLQLASVVGRVFAYPVLRAAYAAHVQPGEGSLTDLDTHLLTLQRGQLIRERTRAPEATYVFKHHLTQEAAYYGLLRSERRACHRQVAQAVEQICPDRVDEQLGLLAHHWQQAGEIERAMACLRRAGEQAAAQFANVEALDYIDRALELVPRQDEAERYALLMSRERIHNLQGERQAQCEDLEALETLAQRLKDRSIQARVALRRAHYAWITGDYEASGTAVQAAIRLAQATSTSESLAECEAEAHRYWGLLLRSQGDEDGAIERFERSLLLAREAALSRLEADVSTTLASAAARRSDPLKARSLYERALCIYQEIGDLRGESRALNYLGAFADLQGDYAEAYACYERALHTLREIGDRPSESAVLINLGWTCALQGHYAQAEAYYRQALRICRETGMRAREETVLSNLSLLYYQTGDHARAHEYGLQALLLAKELSSRPRQGYALTNLGHALAGLGRLPEAADAYRQAVALRRALGESGLVIESVAGLARVRLALGDQAQAQAHVQEILAYLDQDPTLYDLEEPLRVYLTCCQVLGAQGSRAQEILQTAYDMLQQRADKITDAEMRHSFLSEVVVHREIVAAFGEHAVR